MWTASHNLFPGAYESNVPLRPLAELTSYLGIRNYFSASVSTKKPTVKSDSSLLQRFLSVLAIIFPFESAFSALAQFCFTPWYCININLLQKTSCKSFLLTISFYLSALLVKKTSACVQLCVKASTARTTKGAHTPLHKANSANAQNQEKKVIISLAKWSNNPKDVLICFLHWKSTLIGPPRQRST